VFLETGDNKHAQSLAALPTDAGEVLAVIHRRHVMCVHVVNTNTLALEPEGAPAGRREGTVSDPDRSWG
jgi:hypothetical protein